jgi:hypothetical protein
MKSSYQEVLLKIRYKFYFYHMKILQVKNGKIQGNLSSADVEAFQIFEQSLETQLEKAKRQKDKTP